MAAFGPLFLYTPLKKAGETTAIAKLHLRLVMPALVLMWVFGMGLAGVGEWKISSPWLSASIIIWLLAVGVNWFLVRPSLSDDPFRNLQVGGRNRCDPPQPRCGACTDDMEARPLSPNSVQLVNLNRSIVGLGKGIFAIFAAKT